MSLLGHVTFWPTLCLQRPCVYVLNNCHSCSSVESCRPLPRVTSTRIGWLVGCMGWFLVRRAANRDSQDHRDRQCMATKRRPDHRPKLNTVSQRTDNGPTDEDQLIRRLLSCGWQHGDSVMLERANRRPAVWRWPGHSLDRLHVYHWPLHCHLSVCPL